MISESILFSGTLQEQETATDDFDGTLGSEPKQRKARSLLRVSSPLRLL